MDLVYLEAVLMAVMVMLTVICSYLNIVLHQKKYAHHVTFDAAPTKAEKRLLDHPYIYFLGVLAWVIFTTWLLVTHMEGDPQQFYFGFFISFFSILLGAFIGSILIFLYAMKNPEKIAGQVLFKDKIFMALHVQGLLMPCLILLISLSIIAPTSFIFGSLVAAIVVSLRQLLMLRKK